MGMRFLWTVDDVLALKPCLSKQDIQSHFAGRATVTLRDILDMPTLTDEHKSWMACQPGVLASGVFATWQTTVLARAITTHVSTCGIPAVEVWGRAWLWHKNRTAAGAAGAAGAAWGAAKAARATWATEAAWAAWWAAGAARAARAARAAAWAAWAAEAAAAAGAARAAGAAARDVEFTQQVIDLRNILTSNNSNTNG